jgi:hypothetical protein
MNANDVKKMVLTRQNLNRVALLVTGLAFSPGIVFWIKQLLMQSDTTLSAYYAHFYQSLLDVGMDGVYSWGAVCAPYMAYDLFLLIAGNRNRRHETSMEED